MTAKPTARKRTPRLPPFNDLFLRKPLTRLIAQWRREQRDAQHNLGAAIACASRATLIERIRTLRRCASQLSRILKP